MEEFKQRVLKYLDLGESILLIGLPGMGKSRFGKGLNGIYLDTNLIPQANSDTLILFLKDLLKDVNLSEGKHIVVIDSLDKILTSQNQAFFAYLKALRDQHKYQLSYVFLSSKVIGSQYQPLLGDLYELVSEHIEYLPPTALKNFLIHGFNPSKSQLSQVQSLSGGIPGLAKASLIAFRDNQSVNPLLNLKIKALIEEMLRSNPNDPILSQSQLVQEYLTQTKRPDLSASETRLLELLKTHKGQIITKDQICQAVYPEVKNYSGISDHSIDQLIHRLRDKIKNRYLLTTRRGLGYILEEVTN